MISEFWGFRKNFNFSLACSSSAVTFLVCWLAFFVISTKKGVRHRVPSTPLGGKAVTAQLGG